MRFSTGGKVTAGGFTTEAPSYPLRQKRLAGLAGGISLLVNSEVFSGELDPFMGRCGFENSPRRHAKVSSDNFPPLANRRLHFDR